MSALLPELPDDLSHAAERLARGRAKRPWLRVGVPAVSVGLVVAGGALAATGVWTPQVGDGSHPSLISRSAPPAGQLKTLGVLRRTQTAADRGAESRFSLRFQGAHGKVRVGSVRVLGQHAGSSGYVLIPVEGGSTLAGRKAPRDQLCLSARDSDGAGVGCFTLQDVAAGRAVMGMFPAPRKAKAQLARLEARRQAIQRRHPKWKLPRYVQPHGQARLVGLVPDSIASVRFGEGRTAATTAVHENFFEILGPRARGNKQLHYLDANGKEVMHGPRAG